MSKKETITNAIIIFFEENEEIFNQCIEELDSYNGFLGDDRYFEMELLNEFYSDTEPLEILARAFYGYDADTYTTDGSGNRTYGEFNPNRDFFYYNGYGNLVSSNCKDYSAHLDYYFVEELADNLDYIDAISDNEELTALFNEYQEM